jgi:uncharacterized membrane protein YbhN (UPF0104 family)
MKLNLKERVKKPLFWLIFFVILTIIFGILYNVTDIKQFYSLTWYSAIPWISMIAVQMLFAWVINPIRWLIYKIKNKKK